MGTGKSAVGRRVAAHLGRQFFDTDTLIEKETKTSIPNIFAEHGEAHFRTLEKAAIEQVCRKQEVVIATGGGAIVNEENAERLKENGILICLTATPEVILARVQGNADRPLLQGENPLEKIRSLLTTRAEAYARADVTIDTSELDIDRVVEKIVSLVKATQ
ncbi:MAG: shikimate kinase [Deltaproteobacteria bacterium]|nr:shikimate kinase [Deltaproteobacteria bacterium]